MIDLSKKNLVSPRRKNQSNNFSKKELRNIDKKCIFCGGMKNATTIDHVPSKSILLKTQTRPGSHMYGACKSCNKKSSKSDNITGAIFRMEKTVLKSPDQNEMQRFIDTALSNPEIFFPIMDTARDVMVEINQKRTKAVAFDITNEAIFLIAEWYAKCSQAIYFDHFLIPLKVGFKIDVVVMPKDKEKKEFIQELMSRLPFASALIEGTSFHQDMYSYHFLPDSYKNPTKVIIVPVVDNSHTAICYINKKMGRLTNSQTFKVTGNGLIHTHKFRKEIKRARIFRP